MLSNANRLRKQKDIDAVRTKGRGVAHGVLRIKAVPNALSATRFCFIVSSAVAPLAVDRNLFRRRLREAARALMPKMAAGYDVIVWLQRSPSDKSYAALFETLRIIFVKSGLLAANALRSRP